MTGKISGISDPGRRRVRTRFCSGNKQTDSHYHPSGIPPGRQYPMGVVSLSLPAVLVGVLYYSSAVSIRMDSSAAERLKEAYSTASSVSLMLSDMERSIAKGTLLMRHT